MELLNERAENAKRILENPVYREAIDGLREHYRDMIENTSMVEAKEVLEVRKMLHLLRTVEQHIEQVLKDGEFEVLQYQEQKHTFLGDLSRGWRKTN